MAQNKHNLQALYRELDWLVAMIEQVVRAYLKHDGGDGDKQQADIQCPDFDGDEEIRESVYARIVREWRLSEYERLTLALAIAPHLKPEILDVFLGVNKLTDRCYTEFGGVLDPNINCFLPTGQTLSFLMSANDPPSWMEVIRILSPQHRFAEEQIISCDKFTANSPILSHVLIMSEQWFHYLMTGEQVRPELSASFPASPITTPLNWPDLVLDYTVMQQVCEIRDWLEHGNTLMNDWGLNNKVKPGFRAVFYGPPGTGKTLTAALLAKSSGRDIYRVDLSMIVSKYIGETEKNLSRVFDVASYKDWILFFDEADALFGQRTAATTSNDRHANQQTGYLLQRIEDFPGTVILATNLKANMDDAFTRRFQSMINFKIPAPRQRLTLWQNAFHDVCDLDKDVNLDKIAEDHELTGGAIINILRQCALHAISQNKRCINHDEIMLSIKRELRKDNKTLRLN